jgi:hypothetical protein
VSEDSQQPQTMPHEVKLFANEMMTLFESADRNGLNQTEIGRRCGYTREWVNKLLNNVFIPLHQGVLTPLPKWETVNNLIDAMRPQDERTWMHYERRKIKIRERFDDAEQVFPREFGTVKERRDTAKQQAVRLPKSQPLNKNFADPDSEPDMPSQETIRQVFQEVETGQKHIEKEVLDLQRRCKEKKL